ncbi:site-specific integrase [Streptosporangium sp. NPDC051023]|uniref:site-specific integrase n=1 Tax=Streptosporangium sp. NPDC051023 TaxID=3155410 RepID=UPI00344E3EDF
MAAFLETIAVANTAKAYAIALRGLTGELGEQTPLADLEGEAGADRVAAWFTSRWGGAAAAMFRLLYESAARAQEALALDVADLDLRNRRARVRRKGGTVDVIVWRTATACLLPRLLDGRRTGPLFLTGRRARVELPPCDLDPATGQARLSYRRAAELFETATTGLPGGPYTLHQLRHSALTHAAEDGANTSTLLAYSGHTSAASLARYARVSPEAPARRQEGRDLAGRRPGAR